MHEMSQNGALLIEGLNHIGTGFKISLIFSIPASGTSKIEHVQYEFVFGAVLGLV